MKKVIALVGYSGSGKSYFSNFFKNKGWEIISCSKLVQEKLENEGDFSKNMNEFEKFRQARIILQKNPILPGIAISENVNKAESNNLLLDGVKSMNDLKLIKEDIFIIYISSNFNDRFNHIKKFKNKNINDDLLKERDFFDEETGIKKIIEKADIEIENSEINEENIEKILNFIF